MILKRKDEKILRAVRPNAGISVAYRRRLYALVDELHNSVKYWLTAAWRKNEPILARDDAPVDTLRKALAELMERWENNFDEMSPKLAAYFAEAIATRSDATLRRILRDGGFTVKFRMTPAMRDVFRATVQQNVALIRTIPQEYLAGVQGAVMRSVQTGRDLGSLAKYIDGLHQVTRKRAAFIARDQNNKASSALTRARQLDLGLKEAMWLHSHAGKVPRPSHVKMDGKKFDLAKGMWDKDEQAWVQAGELINCRCVARPIIKGFE